MKKLIAIAVAFFLFSFPAMADTTGLMRLYGIVPEFVHISVNSSQISLDLQAITQEPIIVSSIRVWSSCHWSIVVQSKNHGFLENSADPEDRIGYFFTLGALTAVPESLRSVWTSSVQEPTLKTGFELPLIVQPVPTDANLVAGTYEDLLTINIQQL